MVVIRQMFVWSEWNEICEKKLVLLKMESGKENKQNYCDRKH